MKYRPVIILICNQDLVAENFIEKLKSQITDDPAKLLYSSHHFDTKTFSEVLMTANTPSMFHEKKLLYIKNIDPKSILNFLKDLVENTGEFLYIVFKTDKNSKEFLKHKEKATILDLDSDTKLDQHIAQESKKLDLNLTRGAMNALITLLGENLNLIRQELKKISVSNIGREITEKDIFEFTQKQNYDSIYSFIGALASKDLKSALKILKELEQKKEDPIGIISLLTWRIRQIFKTLELLDKGKSNEEIAKSVKTSKGAVYYILKDCKKFKMGELKKIMNLLGKTDRKLKSSSENNYIILNELVLNICRD